MQYEKRDVCFSPTTFFVSCATLNVAGTTKNATAFMVRPTLVERSKTNQSVCDENNAEPNEERPYRFSIDIVVGGDHVRDRRWVSGGAGDG